jgi:predicted 3-demethylubiquinone-9 3-methyltransferase (glyoxalase superfamily)
VPSISPFLWFDSQAEDAAKFYAAIFPHSKIIHVSRYGEAGREVHKREPGSAMTVVFELDGQKFTALNGGPLFRFNESVSFVIRCESQDEVDHYWSRLSEGGDPKAQQCGWLKDKFGLSWQVVPTALESLIGGSDPQGAQRAFAAMMGMKKIVIGDLQRAYDGQ